MLRGQLHAPRIYEESVQSSPVPSCPVQSPAVPSRPVQSSPVQSSPARSGQEVSSSKAPCIDEENVSADSSSEVPMGAEAQVTPMPRGPPDASSKLSAHGGMAAHPGMMMTDMAAPRVVAQLFERLVALCDPAEASRQVESGVCLRIMHEEMLFLEHVGEKSTEAHSRAIDSRLSTPQTAAPTPTTSGSAPAA